MKIIRTRVATRISRQRVLLVFNYVPELPDRRWSALIFVSGQTYTNVIGKAEKPINIEYEVSTRNKKTSF